MTSQKTTLVTGAAGFIGFHVAKSLLEKGERIVGIDNLNPYYDVSLKKDRLEQIKSDPRFTFYREDINNIDALERVFSAHHIDRICNLAAQAGVRYSIQNPFAYEESNLKGFLNLLEMARKFPAENFVFASSSSVYGNNKKLPFSTEDNVDTPISLYAATKKANELMAHVYSHLFEIPLTGLRYFTVYGPWGRPDMAISLFTKAILGGRPIDIYNFGKMKRDFTYIDDIVDGTISALNRPFKYKIFNLGNSKTVELMELIGIIEEELGVRAKKNFLPLQPGDVPETYADTEGTAKLLGFKPKTSIRAGIRKFLAWYRGYYEIK
ncbi:MAG: NAD-dependent epimerase [Deltaproteobacteria bacterium]|nr:NAD-dependent epimerase [Deltaproteobacteria bacterium]MBW2339064.1 NAD-dependent epimerase [Deltaproteobacteria bacterium]